MERKQLQHSLSIVTPLASVVVSIVVFAVGIKDQALIPKGAVFIYTLSKKVMLSFLWR